VLANQRGKMAFYLYGVRSADSLGRRSLSRESAAETRNLDVTEMTVYSFMQPELQLEVATTAVPVSRCQLECTASCCQPCHLPADWDEWLAVTDAEMR